MEIHIGYQSVTSQTWGALVIKNQKIFENKLKEYYPNKNIKVVWHDEISGAVINTAMISKKIHIGFMGDMPLLLNTYKANTLNNYESIILAFDGKGKEGKNQSIIVPLKSEIKSIYDLKGKRISTPIGSSAHFMLMKILKKYKLYNDVEIVHQDVPIASQLLSQNKIDAFAIWEPYSKYLEENKISKVLVDGTESNSDYLAGIVVERKWYDNNKNISELFINSLKEAHIFIKNNPKKAAEIFSKESDFDYNTSIYVAKNISWDCSINKEDIETLIEKQKFLIEVNQIKNFDLNKYILYAKD
ncbi:MAG: ABC transporter substrate-binding protein [Mollicutes bacterium]|nr:ABC transporter substrate-binding protein [Mollicutes bacterium]